VTVVARREILARVRDRTFIISTVFLLVVVAGSSMLSLLLAGGGAPDITVAAVGQRAAGVADAARVLGSAAEKAEEAQERDATGAAAAPGRAPAPPARLDVRAVPDLATAEAQLKSGAVDAAIVPAPGGGGVELVGRREVPPELQALVTAVTAASRPVGSTPTSPGAPWRALGTPCRSSA
jgi:ABC-2 type transport system permease protein